LAIIDRGLIKMDNSTPLTEGLFYILLAVRTPNHGYGIIQDVNDMTNGRVILGPGTLYGAINSMLSKEWISLYSEDKESRKKKEYIITDKGREVFQYEVNRLSELLSNAGKMDGVEV
jgi:DNA-binding PadR family transcriptional regulator